MEIAPLPRGFHVAHLNVARLRARPGDASVAEFVDNVPKVNAVAERSPGFVWRLHDESARVSPEVPLETLFDDPLIAASLSVWETVADLHHFVSQTVHGAFLRRRASWFEPSVGPAYVIWPIARGAIPTLAQGRARLDHLAAHGPSEYAYDFAYHPKTAE